MKWWVLLAASAVISSLILVLTTFAVHRKTAPTETRLFPAAAVLLNAESRASPRVSAGRHSAPRFDAVTLLTPAPPSTNQQRTFLLSLVPSRVDNAQMRQAIRLSYGSVRSERNHTVRTVFVVGRLLDEAANEALRSESKRHGDIVQFDFVDTYVNLTLKTVLALRWAVFEYNGGSLAPEYVLKADEDVLVNYDRVVDLVLSLGSSEREGLYTGYVWHGAPPVRDPSNKYYVSPRQYAGATYPDYVAGPSYLLSAGAASRIVAEASNVPFLDMEDVFVGLCAQLAGLRAAPNPNFGNAIASAYDFCAFSRMITVHGVSPEWKDRYWSERAAQVSPNSRCRANVRRRSIRSVRTASRVGSAVRWRRALRLVYVDAASPL